MRYSVRELLIVIAIFAGWLSLWHFGEIVYLLAVAAIGFAVVAVYRIGTRDK